MATFGRMGDGSYAESEAYDSASVMPIHTRSELSSDSDSAYDSASVASVANVNQPQKFSKKTNNFKKCAATPTFVVAKWKRQAYSTCD